MRKNLKFCQIFQFIEKNIDQNNICASTVFKAKTEEEKNLKKFVDPQKERL